MLASALFALGLASSAMAQVRTAPREVAVPVPVPFPVESPMPFDFGNPMIGAPVLSEPFPFDMPMPFMDPEAGVEAEEMTAGHQKKEQPEAPAEEAPAEEEEPAAREEEKPKPEAREEEEEEAPAEAPHGKKQFQSPRGTVSSKSRAPMRAAPQELKKRHLPDQLQQFFVPLTKNHVENVLQPIEQHVTQPFHQRILRQPVPQVQPYNTRVIQPVIEQTVQPMLSTSIETTEAAEAQYLQPIQNADVVLAARTSSRTEPLVAQAPRAEGKK